MVAIDDVGSDIAAHSIWCQCARSIRCVSMRFDSGVYGMMNTGVCNDVDDVDALRIVDDGPGLGDIGGVDCARCSRRMRQCDRGG